MASSYLKICTSSGPDLPSPLEPDSDLGTDGLGGCGADEQRLDSFGSNWKVQQIQ